MTARAWLNWGLLILLVALALLVWLRPGQTPSGEIRLTSLEPDAVTRIRIQRANQPAIELARQDRQWQLTMPMELPANEVRVGTLLNLTEQTSEQRYPAAKLKLNQYGLAHPLVSVTLNDQTFALGKINPVSYQRYVRVGEHVYLISDTLAALETAEAASYVAPKLLPADAEIVGLKLPKLALERGKDGGWTSSPALPEASIHALLDAWRQAQAYVVGTYKQAATTSPPRQIRIRLADDREISFQIIAREPELILARPKLGIQYRLPADAVGSLLDPQARSAAGYSR
jgi:hypothetical protein